MKTLFKNGKIVNVFTNRLETVNVLIEDEKIIGVGDYDTADEIIDVTGKILCPSFIDAHIHIESSLMTPPEFAKVSLPHGTGAIVADPHEIANVCGLDGIQFFLDSSEGLPLDFYFALPSCVPASPFDESGASLTAEDYTTIFAHERVIALGEMMNFPGVINKDPVVTDLITQSHERGKVVCGHAPLLSGKALDAYISAGIYDDHECSNMNEALEKLRKGQMIIIREGSTTKNLEAIVDLFDAPYCYRCMLCADDKFATDLLKGGHIDMIIRKAVQLGKSAITGIRMATLQTAEYFGLKGYGAIAPGYYANILVLNDLATVDVKDVYHKGKLVCEDKAILDVHFKGKKISAKRSIGKKSSSEGMPIPETVLNSFNMDELKADDFYIEPKGENCHVIQLVLHEILTNDVIRKIDFDKHNGIDVERDILKIAVCERHHRTGHIGLGFAEGFGFKKGAFAGSVAHDSHNLIIAGTNEKDMAVAGNEVRKMGGGFCIAVNGKVKATFPLPIAGLMSDGNAEEIHNRFLAFQKTVEKLNINPGVNFIQNLAFISLPVIPSLKLTTLGLVDVNQFKLIPLTAEAE